MQEVFLKPNLLSTLFRMWSMKMGRFWLKLILGPKLAFVNHSVPWSLSKVPISFFLRGSEHFWLDMSNMQWWMQMGGGFFATVTHVIPDGASIWTFIRVFCDGKTYRRKKHGPERVFCDGSRAFFAMALYRRRKHSPKHVFCDGNTYRRRLGVWLRGVTALNKNEAGEALGRGA